MEDVMTNIECEDPKETERREKETGLLSLISSYGWVLHHPILLSVVEDAPSPKSADNYIMTQFSGCNTGRNTLAQAVRNAVRIKEKVEKGVWAELLKKEKNARLSDLFCFGYGEPVDIEKGGQRITFSTDIKFSEKTIACSHWPLFLREFSRESDDYKETSVDYPGDDFVFRDVDELGESFWNDRSFERGVSSRNYKIETSVMRREFPLPGSVFCQIFIGDKFVLKSQIVKVKPKKGETYHRFYKIVSIYNKDCYGGLCESIDISYPVDSFNNRRREGLLTFSKEVSPVDGRNNSNLYVLLRLNFLFGNDFLLIPKGNGTGGENDFLNYISIRSKLCQENLLFQPMYPAPSCEAVGRAVSRLYEDFLCAWKFYTKNKISLCSILDQGLIKNPPDNLIDFFTGKKM